MNTPTPDDDTLEIGETYQLPMTLNEIDGMTVMYQEEFELRMQKEKELAAALDLQAAYFDRCEQLLDALAAAKERIRELETALLGVKEYREKNPLGGPAKVFDAMADAIRAGDDLNAVCSDYGWCPVERAQAAEARAEENARDANLLEKLRRIVPNLIEVARMPNIEHVADEHNEAVRKLRAAIAEGK